MRFKPGDRVVSNGNIYDSGKHGTVIAFKDSNKTFDWIPESYHYKGKELGVRFDGEDYGDDPNNGHSLYRGSFVKETKLDKVLK